MKISEAQWRRLSARQRAIASSEWWDDFAKAWQNLFETMNSENASFAVKAAVINALDMSNAVIDELLNGIGSGGRKGNRNRQFDPKIRVRVFELEKTIVRDRPQTPRGALPSLIRMRLIREGYDKVPSLRTIRKWRREIH